MKVKKRMVNSMKNAYKLEAILKKRGCFQYKNINN